MGDICLASGGICKVEDRAYADRDSLAGCFIGLRPDVNYTLSYAASIPDIIYQTRLYFGHGLANPLCLLTSENTAT